ncbi:hypothetical protein ACLK1S_08090 [Escherichia coli]
MKPLKPFVPVTQALLAQNCPWQERRYRPCGERGRAYLNARGDGYSLLRLNVKRVQLAHSMEAHAEELALLETLDTGKPIRHSLRDDIPGWPFAGTPSDQQSVWRSGRPPAMSWR